MWKGIFVPKQVRLFNIYMHYILNYINENYYQNQHTTWHSTILDGISIKTFC